MGSVRSVVRTVFIFGFFLWKLNIALKTTSLEHDDMLKRREQQLIKKAFERRSIVERRERRSLVRMPGTTILRVRTPGTTILSAPGTSLGGKRLGV